MKILLITLIVAFSTQAHSAEYVSGYMRQDGTYVQPHYQTAPDGNLFNNYSTQGNTNPYTGQPGNVNPYQQNNNSNFGNSFSNAPFQQHRRSFGY